jgi:glycogen operon protein
MRLDPNAPGHRQQDLIIYEVHPKGFTASPASGVQHPGTFRGVGEKADYFKELGVTAVELMPVMEKPLDGGYWGYQTIGFFAPEISYSYDQRPGGPLDEFKWMVDQLHQRGIEVILDVVYNHTGEGGLWRNKIQYDDSPSDPATVEKLFNFDPKEVAGLYSFRGLDNAAYYALSADNQTFWNNTGVGNDTRCNHAPMRRLILDSLHYWAEELHIDGFRFDLAPILGEKDLDYNVWDDLRFTVLQDIIDDARLQKANTRIFAEPWAAGGPGFKLGKFPAAQRKEGVGWGEWNGHFRDWWRSFVNNDGWTLQTIEGDPNSDGTNFGDLITGSARLFQANGRRPYHSANFVTVHDGFTLYDVFTYNQKLNGCGPLNPVCCSDPTSPFCNRDSGEDNNRSREWRRCDNTPRPNAKVCSVDTDCPGSTCVPDEDFKRQQMRNLFVAMAISRGTPLLYGGDEWMRTQLGNNNAYSTLADNSWNWFDWGVWQTGDEAHRMKDFVAQLNRFRSANIGQLGAATFEDAARLTYKSERNDTSPNWGSRHMMLHYDDPANGAQLAVLINLEPSHVTFTLPTGVSWRRAVDTQGYFDTAAYLNGAALPPRLSANATVDAPIAIQGSSYDVADHSIVILRAGP